MTLIPFLNRMDRASRDDFLARCDTTESYLRKAASIHQKLRPALCVRIERETFGAVTRKDLRPDDWAEIWPELVAEAA